MKRAPLRFVPLAWCLLQCALLASACAAPKAPEEAAYLVVAVRSPPNNLDPRLAADETTARVGELMFSSLMEIGDDLKARPKLAERLDNPDPLTYVAHLRHGVKFHDGHELTARDVAYTYRAYLDPAFVSPYKGAFTQLQAVETPDPYTVVFKLREPFGAFPMQLVAPPVMPEGANGRMSDHPVGTGPYRFVRYAVDDQVVVAAFDEYYEGPPANRGIVIKVVPDDTMRGLELRKKSVDLIVNDMSPDMVHGLEERREVTVSRAPGLDFSYIGINMQDPVLRDKRVRHAIGYAIDRTAIVKYLPRSRRRRSAAAAAAVAEDRRVGGSPAAGDGDPAGPGACRHRARCPLLRAGDAVLGSGQRQLPAVEPAMGRWRGARPGHPAARVPLVAGAAGRLQSRPLHEPGGRSPARPGDRGDRRSHEEAVLR
jgi:peptide/nickel transport system substrate-binding protein